MGKYCLRSFLKFHLENLRSRAWVGQRSMSKRVNITLSIYIPSFSNQTDHPYLQYKYLRICTHWGRYKMAAIFQTTFSNEFSWMKMYEYRLQISLKFVPQGPINNIPALVQIMAWRRPGDKPLSGPMMVRLPMHICITRPQWVKYQNIQVIQGRDQS